MSERPLLQGNVRRRPAGEDAVSRYCVHCPDVVELTVDGHPELSGKRTIGPDGRIDLSSKDRLRIEGCTLPDSVQLVAHEVSLESKQVKVQVAEFNSQQIYVFGPGAGVQRAVPYEGSETVLELLENAGVVKSSPAPDDIYVVRPHISDGGQPQVFRIHLRDISVKQDQETNLRLQPFDQVYIGETRSSSLSRFVAPCLRPIYDALCSMLRPDKDAVFMTPTASPKLTSVFNPPQTYNESQAVRQDYLP
jgi:protein involved in polysaccharide export with SLBB domain